MRTIMITGGAGFIGSALIRHIIRHGSERVVNVDCLTYAGDLQTLESICDNERYRFEQADICNGSAMRSLLARYRPDAIVNLAAETHVDRSIDAPAPFIATNVTGVCVLLEAALEHWTQLPERQRAAFRFHQVSTDEVFGDLGVNDKPFHETARYAPSSPYAASKAGADHLVRAWHRTYGLPTLISYCCNNYGPYQYPEKLIPLMILNALEGKPLPIYGQGDQLRDWLYVDDHARALYRVLQRGRVGESYNIGGHSERRNLDVVNAICAGLEALAPDKPDGVDHYRDLIVHVEDRPGHDRRYAIDAGKTERELGWRPRESFDSGLDRTLRWFIAHPAWGRRERGPVAARPRLGTRRGR